MRRLPATGWSILRDGVFPLSVGLALCAATLASAQQADTLDYSRALTDKVHRGDGVINLLNDISGNELSNYFSQTGGVLMLGVDVNENNSGNENRDSLGVAIKQVQLSISTTEGDFTFSNVMTNTTAMLRESGSDSSAQYQTLFGTAGSSSITSSGNFDLSTVDDVMWMENIDIRGEIIGAELQVSFLETPSSRRDDPTAAESFFDFSGGYEDFALLNTADAVLVESAALGTESVSADIAFASDAGLAESLDVANNTSPAAPAPYLVIMLAFAGLVLAKRYLH